MPTAKPLPTGAIIAYNSRNCSDLPASMDEAINSLLRQVSTSDGLTSRQQLIDLLESTQLTIFVCSVGEVVVGMASLSVNFLLSGAKGQIDDVVVDTRYRGRGYGRLLMKAVVFAAEELNLRRLDLTSANHRVAAIKLYESLGFKRRDTAVYRLTTSAPRDS